MALLLNYKETDKSLTKDQLALSYKRRLSDVFVSFKQRDNSKSGIDFLDRKSIVAIHEMTKRPENQTGSCNYGFE